VLYSTTHNVAEPAGAVATAALMMERERQLGRKVAVIMTGGNLDTTLLQQILAGETPSP
jgi:threonine dehydratase